MAGVNPQLHRSEAGTNPGQDAPISFLGMLTHAHSDWNTVDTPVRLRCPSLGCGRKVEPPSGGKKQKHADTGRMGQTPCRQVPPVKIIFCVCVSHQCNKGMALKEETFFEDLLY